MLASYNNFDISVDDHVACQLFKTLETEALDPQSHLKDNSSIISAIKRLQINGHPLTVQALKKHGECSPFKGWTLAKALAYKASQPYHPQEDPILIPILEAFLPYWSLTEVCEVPRNVIEEGESLLWSLTSAQNKLFRDKISLPILDKYIDELSLNDVRYAPADGPHRGVTVLANLAQNYSDHFVFVVDRLKNQLTLEDLKRIPTVLGEKTPTEFQSLLNVLLTEALLKKTLSQESIKKFILQSYNHKFKYSTSFYNELKKIFSHKRNSYLSYHFVFLFIKYHLDEPASWLLRNYALSRFNPRTLAKVLMYALRNENVAVFVRIYEYLLEENLLPLSTLSAIIKNIPVFFMVASYKTSRNTILSNLLQQVFRHAIVANQVERASILLKYTDSIQHKWAQMYANKKGLRDLQEILIERKPAALTPLEERFVFPTDVWLCIMKFLKDKELIPLMEVNKYFRRHVSQHCIITYFPELKELEVKECEKQPRRVNRFYNDPVDLWNTAIQGFMKILQREDGTFAPRDLLLSLRGDTAAIEKLYGDCDDKFDCHEISAANGHKEALDILIEGDSNLEKTIQLAILLEHERALKRIFESKSDTSYLRLDDCIAIMNGNLKKIKELLKSYKPRDWGRDFDFRLLKIFNAALITSLHKKQDDIFEWLYKEFNPKDCGDNMYDALRVGNVKAVTILLKFENYNTEDLSDFLAQASLNGQLEIARLIFKKIPPSEIKWFFVEAIRNNWPEFMGRLAPLVSKERREWGSQLALACGYSEILQELSQFQENPHQDHLPRLYTPLAAQQLSIGKEPEQAPIEMAAAASSPCRSKPLLKQ